MGAGDVHGATVASRRAHIDTTSLRSAHWAALALALLTGVIHLYVGWERGRPSLALAGLGFFSGIAVFLRGYRRPLLYVLGVGYVVVQIVLWAVFNAGEYTAIGYADKTVQAFLVALLASLYLSDRRAHED